MVESTESSNLPLGVVVNNTLVTPSQSGLVSVILINNNSHNVWIRQPLYWEVLMWFDSEAAVPVSGAAKTVDYFG